MQKARQQKRISKARMARDLGVDRHTITRWEKGGITAVNDLFRVADYLGVSVSYLIGKRATPERAEFLTSDERELLALYRAMTPEGRQGAVEALTESLRVLDRLRRR